MVQSGQLPLVQFHNDERVEWNRLAGRFRLGIALDIAPNGMGNVSLHEFKVDVAPTKSDQLSAAQTGAAVQHDHHTLTLRQFKQKCLELLRGENVWGANPFGRSTDGGDWVRRCPLTATLEIEPALVQIDVCPLESRIRCADAPMRTPRSV